MISSIKNAVSYFKSIPGEVRILTHHDTDGITAGAILMRALQRADRRFKISILKQLDNDSVDSLLKEDNRIIFLLDFGSQVASRFKGCNSRVFILDHHHMRKEEEIPENVTLINPLLQDLEESERISASALSYLFAKEMRDVNVDLACLAVIGMIGDFREAKSSSVGREILKDAKDVTIKRSLLFFPATRPLHKALEFGSNIFIPGVTGSSEGALNLLKEAKISLKEGESYRTLLDLDSEETARLTALITIKSNEDITGNIYLVKVFNHLEDSRELSALINGCGRMGHGYTALEMCLGSKKAKAVAEEIHSEYKHRLITGLKWIASNDKIEDENCMIINAGSNVKDTLIATLMSIISFSFVYPSGKVLVGMADTKNDKVKVSARICGHPEDGIGLHELMDSAAYQIGGEGGGCRNAAGALIPKEKVGDFISIVQKEIASMQKSIAVH